MIRTSKAIYCLIVITLLITSGCARTMRDTRGFSIESSITVDEPFEQAWQTVKKVLRDQNLDIYTRDKRGVFVAHTKTKRHLLVPHRIKHTITLEKDSDTETRITVESINQVYGVTISTYPGWHDRKTAESPEAQMLLDAILAEQSV